MLRGRFGKSAYIVLLHRRRHRGGNTTHDNRGQKGAESDRATGWASSNSQTADFHDGCFRGRAEAKRPSILSDHLLYGVQLPITLLVSISPGAKTTALRQVAALVRMPGTGGTITLSGNEPRPLTLPGNRSACSSACSSGDCELRFLFSPYRQGMRLAA